MNYTFTVGSGSIVPGTTDTGNHTDDNSTLIMLPFSYQMYDTSFANVAVGSNGHLTFGTVNNAFNPTCIPIVTATYAIFPYETDQCTGPCTGVTGTTYGIFTSTSGVAPNRIFNIEWRTAYYNSGGAGIPLNYEVRLYEGQTAFDVIYGTVPATFTPPAARNLSVGAQRTNTTQFVLEGCDTTGGGSPPVSAGQLYHYTLGGCATPTPSPSGTPSPTPTATVTATATATATAGGTTATPTCVPQPPLTQGFDDITTLPGAGWVQTNHSTVVGTTNWFQEIAPCSRLSRARLLPYIGANFNNTTGTNTISNWLLTPPVTLQNGATMTFYTRTVDAPAFPDRLQVRMSTNGASSNVGTTATDVGDFTTLLLDINPTYTLSGYPERVDASSR